ncbi:MAG TPA: hypothetical protein VN458_12575 [Solirubrobacterales bacterium]|nr:hypothetical protein [Solirubrobacterales bacterium]
MGKVLLIALAVLVVLAVASQFVIPPVAENRVEDRLTSGGGSADVSLDAFPAVRLLFGDGDRVEVRGNGLDLNLERETNVFDNLDGFDEVDVSLADYRAGPFQIRTFELARDGSEATYHLVLAGSATPADIAAYGADRLGLVGGPLLGAIAAQLAGKRPVPIDLDMQLRSEDGRVVVESGGGTVAGLPAGLLAQVITSAIVVRL